MQDRTSQQATVHDIAAQPTDLLNLHELVVKARQNLNQNDWDYIVGGCESETTLRRNRMALDSLAFRPRVLRDVSNVDCSVTQFGRKLRIPVVLAPVGSLESFHALGAESVVRAVGEFGAAHMLSSVCDPGLEDLAAAAPQALRLYQLYVRGDTAWVDDHVERAIAHGYTAFCLTVDTAHYSRRERDIAKRFVTAGRRRVQGRAFQAGLDWATVKKFREGPNPARWKGHLSKLLPAKNKISAVTNLPAIPYEELPTVMETLRRRPEIAARALEFTLLTAIRPRRTSRRDLRRD